MVGETLSRNEQAKRNRRWSGALLIQTELDVAWEIKVGRDIINIGMPKLLYKISF